jgi:hypothetical protein
MRDTLSPTDVVSCPEYPGWFKYPDSSRTPDAPPRAVPSTALFSSLILEQLGLAVIDTQYEHLDDAGKSADCGPFSRREIAITGLKGVRSSKSNIKSANQSWGFI